MTLKKLQEQTGMTQTAFADYFGIPLRTVQHWINGDRECPVYLLRLMEYKLLKEDLIRKDMKGE